MYDFLTYVAVFQIVTDIYDVLVGSALVYGALKWRKGLLSTTAIYWGLVLGVLSGSMITYSFEINYGVILITLLLGGIIFPILTYRIPAVNRFVLGFIVSMKMLYMLTTYLFKNGSVDLDIAILLPLIVATLLGVIFMLLRQLSVLPFALGCVFIGASQVAPTVVKYINQIIFGITKDYSLLFDPVDFLFALFKIELTDGWTLLVMIIFMCIGVPLQLKYIKQQGYDYDTPVIAFETDDPNMHGKIVSFK